MGGGGGEKKMAILLYLRKYLNFYLIKLFKFDIQPYLFSSIIAQPPNPPQFLGGLEGSSNALIKYLS